MAESRFITLLLMFLIQLTKGLYNPHPHEHHHNHPPHYEFGYSVHDRFTGDIKDHHEERHGDHVEGRYSLIEPTGGRRVVKYHADDHNGFNAIVHCEDQHHPSPVVPGPAPPPPPPPPEPVHPPHPVPHPHPEHHDHEPQPHPIVPDVHPVPFKAKLIPVPFAFGFQTPSFHPIFLMPHSHIH